jgi:hypothetical protein
VKGDAYFFTRAGIAPDGDFDATLEHHMIAENRGEADIRNN